MTGKASFVKGQADAGWCMAIVVHESEGTYSSFNYETIEYMPWTYRVQAFHEVIAVSGP